MNPKMTAMAGGVDVFEKEDPLFNSYQTEEFKISQKRRDLDNDLVNAGKANLPELREFLAKWEFLVDCSVVVQIQYRLLSCSFTEKLFQVLKKNTDPDARHYLLQKLDEYTLKEAKRK